MPTLSEEETQKHLSSAIQAPGPSPLSGGAESNMSREELEALEAKRAEKREVCVPFFSTTCFPRVPSLQGLLSGVASQATLIVWVQSCRQLPVLRGGVTLP
jgi:hypothetical protein